MNTLLIVHQLETCLAQSVQQGIDFQVAQLDLDFDVEAMEQNMKEGLDNRTTTTTQTCSF
eukprot:14664857-Ditylum_brightwellii.AAC.1